MFEKCIVLFTILWLFFLLFYLLYLLIGAWVALEVLNDLLPKFLERNELLEKLKENLFTVK